MSSTQAMQAMPRSSLLLPVQLAAMEAARAVWEMLGENQHEDFVVIGGAALLFHGANIKTEDADLAVTGNSYTKFINAAKNDSRFTKNVLGPWEYKSTFDFVVKIDFLDKNGDGGYSQELREYSLIDGIPVATPIDLAIGKGTAWVDRQEPKDLDGLEYALGIMAQQGWDFKSLDARATECLDDIKIKLEESVPGLELLI